MQLDFMIIGFPKCGTTTIAKSLEKHNKINLFNQKIYLCETYFLNININFDYYSNNKYFFKKFWRDGKINGCKNPLQISSLFNLKILYNLNPEMKIIICMRNPVKALISFYFMLKKNDFYLNDFNHYFENNKYSYFYINYIIWANSFFKNIHYFILKKYEKNPVEELNKIFKFLGVDEKEIEMIHENKNNDKEEIENELIDKLREYYKEPNELLFKFLGRRIPEWE